MKAGQNIKQIQPIVWAEVILRRSYKQIGVTISFSYEECAKANSKRRAGTF